jgi:exopolysaccharide biosynthesis polyprenyl glycosylphosphotransferase
LNRPEAVTTAGTWKLETSVESQPSPERRDVIDLRPAYERPTIKPLHRNRTRVVTLVRVTVDIVAIAAALATATAIRFGGEALEGAGPYGLGLAVWVPIWWTGLVAAQLYDQRRIQNPAEELRRLVRGVTLGSGISIMLSFIVNFPLSRAWILVAWLVSLGTLAAGRRAIRKAIHAFRRRGRLRHRGLIVGADSSGLALAEAAAKAPWEGIDVVGFVALGTAAERQALAGIPIVGAVPRLRELSVALGVSQVLVAPTVAGNGHLGEVMSALDGVPVDVRVEPGLAGFLPSSMALQPLGDRAILAIERIELRPAARVAKRALDVLLGGILLILLLPVIAVCAVAVRVDSPGGAFFRQKRVGLRGTEFTMLKLRTMTVDAEAQRRELANRNESSGVLFKIRDDPRVTRVGRFLRRTSLDELPQLLNVLRGQMSLVGPRPPLPEEVARYDDALGRRLLVRPGITGLWQVSGRHDLAFEDYARYDLMYIQNWSIALDLYILAKTVPAVLSRRGAY